MREFEFEGVKYVFDANKCYNGSELILLPDGRVLSVTGGWRESYPPIPCGLVVVDITPAVRQC